MDKFIIKDLTLDSVFDFCSVLDAIGLDAITGAFSKKEIAKLSVSGKDSQSIGADIAVKIPGIIVKNLPKAKNEICVFLANCLEHTDGATVTAEEVRGMKIGEFMKVLKEFFARDDLSDFFGELAEFTGTNRTNSPSASSDGMWTRKNT